MRPIKIQFIALGCPKNQVDSEKMLALLVTDSFLLVDSHARADVVIINTCGFIESARAEACDAIEEMLALKRAGRVRHVIVTGCLAQFWGKRLIERYPDIDGVIGLAHRDEISRLLRTILAGDETRVHVTKQLKAVPGDQARLLLNDPFWAYLRISEGCDQGCSFCTIPKIRGRFRSKSPEAILAEAHELVANGAVELNIIGQETTGYGRDFSDNYGLADLLKELNKIDKLQWIRVLYAHPATFSRAIIDAMASCKKVVPYIDLPLQHISDRILTGMNRHVSRREIESLLQKLRKRIPDITIRTTMIVGFPGETDAEFHELLDFVREFRFDALGAFTFCPEEKTKAGMMKNQISETVKEHRLGELMILQQEIAFQKADALKGRKVPCLLTGEMDKDAVLSYELPARYRWFWGRHSGQADDIDSECLIRVGAKSSVDAGQFITAEITGRDDYDLIGRHAAEPPR